MSVINRQNQNHQNTASSSEFEESNLLHSRSGTSFPTQSQSATWMLPRVHLMYMFSSPLIHISDNKATTVIHQLDFDYELERFVHVLDKSNRALKVSVTNATRSNLRSCVTSGCRAIHFSGHGLLRSLAFEMDGKVDEVSVQALREYLSDGQGISQVEFVFISACQSREVGNVFVEAGVPHVIAVRDLAQINDVSAHTFLEQFYLAILAGKTVQAAYTIALGTVRASPNVRHAYDGTNFVLLPENGDHEQQLFSDIHAGKWQDSSERSSHCLLSMLERSLPIRVNRIRQYTNLPSVCSHFMGRDESLYAVVKNLMSQRNDSHRLVTITGPLGIGKSALAIAAAHYMWKRSIFDGVYFINCKELSHKASYSIASLCSRAMDLQTIINCNTTFIDSVRLCKYLFIFDGAECTLTNPPDSPNSLSSFIRSLIQNSNSRVIITSLVPLHYINLLNLNLNNMNPNGTPNESLSLSSSHHATNRIHNLNGDEVLLSGLTPVCSSQLFFACRPRALAPSDVTWVDEFRTTNILFQNPVLAACEGFPGRILQLVSHLTMKSLNELKPVVEEIVRNDIAMENRLYASILSKYLDEEGIAFWFSIVPTGKYRAFVKWNDLSLRMQTLFIEYCNAANRPLILADFNVFAEKLGLGAGSGSVSGSGSSSVHPISLSTASSSDIVPIAKYVHFWSTFFSSWLKSMKRLSNIWLTSIEDLKSCHVMLGLVSMPEAIPMHLLTSTISTKILPDSYFHNHLTPILFSFLDTEEQMNLLSDLRPYKFLIRLSQTMSSALAISYNDGFGNYQKTLIYLEKDGFRLYEESHIFKSLNELILSSFPLQYIYPLESTKQLFSLTIIPR